MLPEETPFTEEEMSAASGENEDDSPDTPANDAPPVELTAREFPTFEAAANLIREKSALTRRLKEVDGELNRLQPLVSAYFAQHGMPRIPLQGVTLYIRRDLWARPKFKGGQKDVCLAMCATGYGHFVHDTYDVSAFSAHVRELERANLDRIDSGEIPDVSAALPPDLAKVLSVSPTYKLMGTITDKKSKKE